MTTVPIDQLQSSLDGVENLGHDETSFTIEGHDITLRTIRPREMKRSHAAAHDLFQEAQETENTFMIESWFKRLKIEVLSYVITEIDGTNLRGIDYITRHDPDSGEPQKEPKHRVVRDIVESWQSTVIDRCFDKFQELTTEVEGDIKDQVEVDYDSPEERIEVLQNEIDRIRDENNLGDEGENEDMSPTDVITSENTPQSPAHMTEDDIREVMQTPADEDEDPQAAPSEQTANDDVSPSRESADTARPETQESPRETQHQPQPRPQTRTQEQRQTAQEVQGDQQTSTEAQKRMQQARARDHQPSGREPLNQQPAHVQEGPTPNPSPQTNQTETPHDVPQGDNGRPDPEKVAGGFADDEPERINPHTVEEDAWDDESDAS